MVRPLRVQYEDAVYHVTARGNERKNIVRNDKDREKFLKVLSDMVEEYEVIIHAWVLMDNHYHLMIETPHANLSKAIRHLNGVYTQKINKKYGRAGHLFQGRYKSILVQKDAYLKELCRYVVLNPVRAKMVKHPGQWKWSSYRATAGLVRPEPWLTTKWLISQFGADGGRARKAYRKFVAKALKKPETPWDELKSQMYLGGEEIRGKIGEVLGRTRKLPVEITKAHAKLGLPEVEKILKRVAVVCGVKNGEWNRRDKKTREARRIAIYLLRTKSKLGLREIGERFGIGYSAVSHKLIEVRERSRKNDKYRGYLESDKFKT